MAEEHQTPPTEETPKSESPLRAFVTHQRNAAREVCQAVEALVPPDVRTHSREARKEFLLSFKSLLEGVSEIVDNEAKRSKPGDSGPSTTGKNKVRVEVS